jgi:hypothetical protein
MHEKEEGLRQKRRRGETVQNALYSSHSSSESERQSSSTSSQ